MRMMLTMKIRNIMTNFKKEINYYLEFNELQDVLIDLYNKEDKEYFSRFIFYLFNYKNWFQNKKPRKPKKRKN